MFRRLFGEYVTRIMDELAPIFHKFRLRPNRGYLASNSYEGIDNPSEAEVLSHINKNIGFVNFRSKRIERKVDVYVQLAQPFLYFVIKYCAVGGYHNF